MACSLKLCFTIDGGVSVDNFKRMALFAQVVRHGSLSAAGRVLGISTSAVSQQLRALERDAGVPLLHRSTRALALTDVGSRYYAACLRLLDAADEAQAQLSVARGQPQGTLRLSAPLGMAGTIGKALGDWLLDNPQLRLQLHFDDGWTDLVQARIDLAIRFGQLPDSDWMAEPLGDLACWLCAAPAWLQRHGRLLQPQQIPQTEWLGRDAINAWRFRHRLDAHEQVVAAHPRIISNSQPSLLQLCMQGLGVAVLPGVDAAAAVASGQLRRLLPDWQLPALQAWAVTPHRQLQPAKVSQAIARLRSVLADEAAPGDSGSGSAAGQA